MERPFDISVVCSHCGTNFLLEPDGVRLQLQSGALSLLLTDCQSCSVPLRLSVPSAIVWALAWAGLPYDTTGELQFDVIEEPEPVDNPMSPPEIIEMLRTLGDERRFQAELRDLLRRER